MLTVTLISQGCYYCLSFCGIQISQLKQELEAERSEKERMASEFTDLAGKLDAQKQELKEKVGSINY